MRVENAAVIVVGGYGRSGKWNQQAVAARKMVGRRAARNNCSTDVSLLREFKIILNN